MKLLISALLTGAVFVAAALNLAQATLPLAVDGDRLPSIAPMVERVQSSLVRIAVQTQVRGRRDPFDDPFFRRFFDQSRGASQIRETFATGVVVDGLQGLILTNEHAVRGADKIDVFLEDGRKIKGEVIGSDVTSDVALVKVNVVGLVAIDIADSNQLRIGDFVVSIGDPLGDENTLVTGVVSALAREYSLQAHQNFIRSDAAAGPGILVNLKGELVGINIAKSAQTAGNLRIGFSTPANMALRVQKQLVQYGTPQRGFLAIQVQDLTPSLANAFDIDKDGGVVVTSVGEGSSAARAGIEVGDVILEAGTRDIIRSNDLRTIVGQQFSGDPLPLLVFRQGQRLALQPILESSTRASRKGTMIHHQLEGATFKETDARQVSTNSDEGVLVSQVKQGSIAWEHGVRPNDLIVSANRKSVRDLATLREAIKGKDVLMLNIVRGNGAMFLLLQ